jgi:hypothetical protein
MIQLTIPLALAVALASAVLLALKGRCKSLNSLQTVSSITTPIDLQAFLLLVDQEEDNFLKRRIPRKHYHRVRQQRIAATVAYIKTAAANAAVLVRVGEYAQNDSRKDVRDRGRELSQAAILFRLYAFVVIAKLRFSAIINFSSAHTLLDHYRSVVELTKAVVQSEEPSLFASVDCALVSNPT